MFDLQLISRMKKEDGGKERDQLCTPVSVCKYEVTICYKADCYVFHNAVYVMKNTCISGHPKTKNQQNFWDNPLTCYLYSFPLVIRQLKFE